MIFSNNVFEKKINRVLYNLWERGNLFLEKLMKGERIKKIYICICDLTIPRCANDITAWNHTKCERIGRHYVTFHNGRENMTLRL